ncbi:MAG: DUF309 domain-containing protein, partial [Gemmataceae bacterium]|nr:DUF309 domain-containing protein [Gemmataceae bacterium]
FEAHEVWEDLWSESHGDERRFYQGMIQAAVGLCHFSNGNLAGAAKLYRSAKDYMGRCPPTLLGLDIPAFWASMERCFAPVLGSEPPDRSTRPDEAAVPRIALVPPPEAWPDPDDYLPEDEE